MALNHVFLNLELVHLQNIVVVRGDVAPKDSGEVASRILFCAKEAVFKAVYPVDGRFLGFEDVTVNFDSGLAETSNGRQVSLSLYVDHRIVVLAQLRAVDWRHED